MDPDVARQQADLIEGANEVNNPEVTRIAKDVRNEARTESIERQKERAEQDERDREKLNEDRYEDE